MTESTLTRAEILNALEQGIARGLILVDGEVATEVLTSEDGPELWVK